MRFLLSLIALLTAFPSLACDDLRGRWESEARTAGGMGQVFEFTGTGVVFVTLSGIADSRYLLEGNRLSSVFASPDDLKKPIKLTYEITVEATTLTMKEMASGNVQKMIRVGPRPSETRPLLGLWKWEHPSGLQASTRFTEEGEMMTRLPIKTEKGSYLCVTGSVSIEMPGKKSETRPYHLERGVLTLDAVENRGPRRFRAAQ